MRPNNFSQDHLVKIELLVTNVMTVGSPARTEREILGMTLNVFRPIQGTILVAESLCDLGILS